MPLIASEAALAGTSNTGEADVYCHVRAWVACVVGTEPPEGPPPDEPPPLLPPPEDGEEPKSKVRQPEKSIVDAKSGRIKMRFFILLLF